MVYMLRSGRSKKTLRIYVNIREKLPQDHPLPLHIGYNQAGSHCEGKTHIQLRPRKQIRLHRPKPLRHQRRRQFQLKPLLYDSRRGHELINR